jgi:fatty-acid peroxygenase
MHLQRTNQPVVPELSVAMLRHGYDALPRLWSTIAPDDDAVEARLLGKNALVVRGADAARLFYDDSLVERRGAAPRAQAALLFGRGAIHGLDGAEHRERKAMFVSALARERVEQLGEAVDRELHDSALTWPGRVPFGLFDELVRIYGACVIPWSGIVGDPGEFARIAQRLAWIVDGCGFAPAAYSRGWYARLWANRWATRLVEEARNGRHVPPGSVLDVFSSGPGRQLPAGVAGVELLNMLRPTVAVAWLGTFAGLALVRHPEHGSELADPAAGRARWAFAEEVRRLTPFVPALAGRVRRTAHWRGHHVRPGDFLVLDVPGTNRHRSWQDPEEFRPERFLEAVPGPFDLVPQGGGDLREGHRCPGEGMAMTLLDRTLLRLGRTALRVTTQEPDRTRIPTLPAGGVVITEARPDDAGFLSAAS